MKIYLVGGAVRDQLLGLPVKEKDYVVVHATVDEMLKQGFRQVGKEFPVFLHPKTNEEYALARMERKVALGYKGFEFDTSPSVTLEEDLARRDLTINAMAQSLEGELIDPYHGKKDLNEKLLRHVSNAFVEDPVRILRVGRFLARFAYLNFKVAPETSLLMKEMVTAGEVDALVAERVWKEFERALTEKNPEKFFEVLEDCGALAKLFPNLTRDSRGIAALKAATTLTNEGVIRFAALMYQTPANNLTILARRFKFPNNFRELAELTARYYARAFKAASAEELLDVLTGLDVFRRDERFQKFLLTCAAIAQVEGVKFERDKLIAAANLLKQINVQELIAAGFQGNDLAAALNKKRLEVLRAWLK